MATRIAVMDGGVIQQIGTPDEIYEQPANLFVAQFIGTPSMNMMRGEIRHQDGKVLAELEALDTTVDLSAHPFAEKPSEGSRIVLGLRPEHAELNANGLPAQFSAPVRYAEKTGSDATAFVDTKSKPFAIRIDPDDASGIKTGQEIKFGYATERFNLFDANSGRRI